MVKYMSDKERKYLGFQWAGLVTLVWAMFMATVIYLADGSYPEPYVWWFCIFTLCGGIIPWCFCDYRDA